MLNTHGHTEEIIKRLSKIEGHIRGVKKMLEENKPCSEVLIQFSAIQSALARAGKMVLEDHFDHCIISNVKDKTMEYELNSFKKALDMYLK